MGKGRVTSQTFSHDPQLSPFLPLTIKYEMGTHRPISFVFDISCVLYGLTRFGGTDTAHPAKFPNMLCGTNLLHNPAHDGRMDTGLNQHSLVGLLIFAFYFTSNILLYYQHLLVKMEQRSKKDLDSEQLLIS